ncbi:SpaA isopeptide-forming pilin-related protein [Eubacterium maltosivorans]|uniref:SpaA isopeptide-forming pilin-related protein n=1 Tax=Eubacterium maltosivorans TaxID=2041044 RepID=UPI003A8F088D
MREKSKKTIKTRLLALLLVFCMTCQMVSYSPGNVVRAEGEITDTTAWQTISYGDGILNPVVKATSIENSQPFVSAVRFPDNKTGYTKDNPTVNIGFDFKFDDNYLTAVFNQLSTVPDDITEYDAWLEKQTITPITFSCDLGVNFKEESLQPLPTNGDKTPITTADGMEIGHYTCLWDSGKQSYILSAVFDNNIMYNPTWVDVSAGFSLKLDLTENAIADADRTEVNWDDSSHAITVQQNQSPEPIDPEDQKFKINKEAATTTDKTYIDYTVTAEIPAIPKDGEDKLNGFWLVDKLPTGMEMAESSDTPKNYFAKVTYTFKDGTTQTINLTSDSSQTGANIGKYTVEGGQLYSQIPESGKAVTKAVYMLRMQLNKDKYKEYLTNSLNKNWTFQAENTASLKKQKDGEPLETSQPANTTMDLSFFSKDSEQNPQNGLQMKWNVNVDTSFSKFVNAWFIDSMDAEKQVYNLNEGFTVYSLNESSEVQQKKYSAGNGNLAEVTDESLKIPYGNLKNSSYSDDLKAKLNNIKTQYGSDKAYYYTYTEQPSGTLRQVLLLPYDQFTNQKIKINYLTDLSIPVGKTEDEYLDDLSQKTPAELGLGNVANLIWKRVVYGEGVGYDDFNFDVNIEKNPTTTFDLVSKKAENYDPATQIMDWSFTTNRYSNVPITGLTITDTLSPDIMALNIGSLKYTKDGSEQKKEIPKDSADADGVYYTYDSGTGQLVIYCKEIEEGHYFTFDFSTKVVNPEVLSQQGQRTVENSAEIQATAGSTPVDKTISGEKSIDNTLVTKVTDGDYDYSNPEHLVNWKVEIDPNHLPIISGQLVDTLPLHTSFYKLNGISYNEGEKQTVSDTDNTKKSVKIKGKDNQEETISWSATPRADKEISREVVTFTLPDSTQDNGKAGNIGKYTLYFSTQIDEDYLKSGENNNKGLTFINDVELQGKVTDPSGIKQVDIKAESSANEEIQNKALQKNSELLNNGRLKWTVMINENQVDMGGMTLNEDLSKATPSDLMSVYGERDGFKLYAVTLDAQGNVSNKTEIKDTDGSIWWNELDNTINDQSFSLKIPGQYKKTTLMLEFETFILDNVEAGSTITNAVQLAPDSEGTDKDKIDASGDYDGGYNMDQYAKIRNVPFIQVLKTSKNGEDIKVEGASFTLTPYEINSSKDAYIKGTSKTAKTGKTGYASFIPLKKDVVYKLEETIEASGYSKNTAEIKYFQFDNTGKVTAAEKILKESDADTTGTKITPQVIQYGKYTIIQSEKWKNTPTGKLSFTKTGAETSTTGLQGVKFTLKRDDQKWDNITDNIVNNVKTATSGTGGKVVFTELDPGEYTLEETEAPEEYKISNTAHKVVVNADGTVTMDGSDVNNDTKISNTYISGNIELTKKDAQTTAFGLESAIFALYRGNSTEQNDKITETTSIESGKVTFSNVPYSPDGYTVKEISAPAGYQITSSQPIRIEETNLTITKNQKFVCTVTPPVENTRIKGTITLTKTKNDNSSTPASGKKFQVVYIKSNNDDDFTDWQTEIKSNGTGLTEENGKYYAITDNNGKIALTDVPYGKYQLIEVSAGGGDDHYKPLTVTVDKPNVAVGDTTYSIEKSAVNELRTTSLKIEKTDDVGDLMGNVQFTLNGTNQYNETVAEQTQITGNGGNDKGSVIFDNIQIGTYELEEKQISGKTGNTDGYVGLKAYDVKVTADPNGTGTITEVKEKSANAQPLTPDGNGAYTITNTPVTGRIAFTKKDADGRNLKGITFELQRIVNGTAQMSGGRMVFEATSGDNGLVQFENIPYADYKLVEKAGAEGAAIQEVTIHKSDLTVKTIDVAETFDYIMADVTNTLKQANIQLTKQDQNGLSLENITFALQRQAESEKDNKPDSFVLNPKNAAKYFSYYDKEGHVVEATSDENGILKIEGLVYGNYKLVEKTAGRPEDIINTAPDITFSINEKGEAINPEETDKQALASEDGYYNLGNVKNTRAYGQAKLTKTVTDSDETLSGVPFKLYKYTGDAPDLSEPTADTLIADDLTTDAAGVIDTSKLTGVTNEETKKVLSAGLWTGKYYFLEQPSDGLYNTNNNVQLVEFEITADKHYTGDNPVTVAMTNDKFTTNISFTKYDTTDSKGIEGVNFTLKRSSKHDGNYDETINTTIKTDADGKVTLALDKKGQYQLTEAAAPAGYDKNAIFVGTFEITDADYNQTISLNQTARMTVTGGTLTDGLGIANTRLPGSMTITKVDAQKPATKLNGAAFTLYQVAEDKKETAVLNGVTGKTYTVGNLDPDSTAGNTGELIITNLPWGHYKLVETTPPDGYILSSTPLEFTIKAGQVDFGAVQSAATTIQNAQSVFTLNKADASSDNFVNGAAFALTDESGTEVWKTPENTAPVSTWSDTTGILVAGKTYTLTETKAPDGYEKAAPVKIAMNKQGVITVTEGEDYASITENSTITVKDQPIEIGLEKIDAESNAALSGAEFEVKGTFAGSVGGVITVTPENFKEELKGHLIAGGTYTLREITPPKGYVVAGSIAFTVNDAGQVTITNKPEYAEVKDNETIVLKNTQNEIFIQKTDAGGKAIGGGAEFSLSGVFADGETVKTIETKEAQPYSLKGLLIAGQRYTLTETRAADGYKLETRAVEITMSAAGTIKVAEGTDKSLAEVTADGLTLKFKDQLITLSLQKTDANNGNRPLKGAKFELTGDLADGSKKNTIDLTQKDSESLSALLIASTGTEKHEYTLTETTAPEGYQLQQTPVKFTVDKDGRVTITNIDAVKGFAALTEDKLSLSFANTLKQGNITFIKYGTNDENDLNAKAELSGAVFGLYTDAGATIPVKDAAGKALTATSGEDGNVAFKDIYVGTYYMKEIAAPSSYTADSTVYQAVIDKDGKCDGLHAVAGTEVSNEAIHEITNQTVRGKISIEKTDSFDNKAIKDIEFTLTKKDKAGKDITVKTGKTDEDGKLAFSDLLMDTEYRVYETKTHSGYVLSTVTENVTLSTEETKKAVAFTNDPTKLTFKKVDTTGAGLAGAEFTLYDGSQEKATATSGKDGMVTFLYLEKGKTYTVKETKRPGEDYLPSSTEFKAEVDKDGTCTLKNNDETITEVVNADAGVITVNKTGADSKPLADTTFVLKNGNGEVIQTQTTGADGKLVFADVPMGSYTIVETAAPDPYAVSGDVTAVTLSRGANQKVSVSRVNTLSQVIFHKRGVITEGCAGNLQHAPLEGAVYGLYQDPECATEPVYTATSSNPGEGCRVIFTGVARGTWYVKEIEAPQYYTLDTTVYKAVVDGDGHFEGLTNLDDTKVADNRVVDAAVTTDIVLKKVNEQKPDEVLPDSTYGLFKKVAKTAPVQARAFSLLGTDNTPEADDESEWQKIAEATTGQDGYLRFEGVLMGVEYSIRELKAPEGSHVSEKPVTIKFGVNDAGTPVIESIDLGLADPNDPNSAPTASVDPETGEIVWLEPSIVAEISKTDMNANLLAGAKLRITVKDENGAYVPLIREDGQPVEWISGDQPGTFVKLMKIGKDYRLEEIEAPSGYKLAAPVDFIVKSPEQGVGPGENLSEQVVLKNELTSLFISKTTVNGTDELPGAVLTVYEAAEDGSIVRDEAGNEVVARTITDESLSWTSGTEMKKIEGLPAGAYVLREITAPDGYEVAEEITFTLMPDGAVTVGGEACEGNIVRMQDKPAPETVTPGVPDEPQTSTPNNPEISGGADTGIAGSVSPATFWGVMALLSVTALLVCSVVVWRRKRW